MLRLFLPLALVLTGCDNGRHAEPVDSERLVLMSDCDVEQGCLARAEDLVVRFDLGPDARPLRPFPVRLQVEGNEDIAGIAIEFSMRGMEMGLNRYLLQPRADGRWVADVTLPVCTSGRSDWIARLELSGAERRYVVDIPFSLEK